MIRASSVIKLNMPRLRQLTQAQVAALEQTAEALQHTEVVQAQVVPFRTGNLQNESMFVDTSESSSGKVSIVHSTPHARRLYFHPEYNFSTEENPNAGAHWFDEWLPGGNKEDWARDMYKKFYRRIAGT